jgi:hypothetical protein
MANQRNGREVENDRGASIRARQPAPGKQTRAEERVHHGGGDELGFAQRAGSKPAARAERAGDWTMDAGSLSAMGLDLPESEAPDEQTSSGQRHEATLSSPEGESSPGPGNEVAGPSAAGASRNVSTGSEGSLLMGTADDLSPPKPGINLTGFIDHSDGAFVRAGPAEAGSPLLHRQPLAPATRVFVSGVHPMTSQWWYVTAFLPDEIVRGYVQDLRVTTDLPEPTAKLHLIRDGETAEKLAVQEFSSAVRDGHDLRYYENILLKVNRDKGRAGIVGAYQDPGMLGGGANNIQLVAGHRIWLVSPAYARTLEGSVPDGSLTNGAVAKAKRFAGHLEDLLASVTQSPSHLDEVAGELAQTIRDHLAEVIGITAAFLVAESISIAAAASPTGVGQLLAFLIQVLLAALGAAAMVEAASAALSHGSQWMALAWAAKGSDAKVAAASREFVRMLVALAMAALAYKGAKASTGKSASILIHGGGGAMPALATGGTQAVAGPGVLLGPPSPFGGVGVAGGMMAEAKGGGESSAAESSVKLTGGGKKVLRDPALQALKDDTVAKAITTRGGGAGQVQQVASHLREKPLGEVANMAAQGDREAETAIKLVKQASSKAQKYGGKS